MITNLIISGGSTKTIAVLGCLKFLEEQSLLTNVKTFVGTSAGSLICFFLVLGFASQEIIQLLRDHFFGNNLHKLSLDEVVSLEVFNSFGMDSGMNITTFITEVLFLKKHVKDISFLDLAKTTGKHLVICGANITKERSEHFSVDTHPDMSVLLALRISVSLPFIFTPVYFNGCYYVDGGVFESLPTSYICKFKDPIVDTLALNTVSHSVNGDAKIDSLLDYVRTLFEAIINKANKLVSTSPKIRVVEIEFEDIDNVSFSLDDLSFQLSDELIGRHLDKGYAVIKQHFEKQMS